MSAVEKYLASRELVLGNRVWTSLDPELAGEQLAERFSRRRLAIAWLAGVAVALEEGER